MPKRSRRNGMTTWNNCIKKDLNEPDYYDDVVSHPEPDILEWEVKRALRSTAIHKASGCNEIPAELFKSLKDCREPAYCILSAALSQHNLSGSGIACILSLCLFALYAEYIM